MVARAAHKEKELLNRVEKALDSIRPYLEADGGNVRVVEITTEKLLRLEFIGNCGNCPKNWGGNDMPGGKPNGGASSNPLLLVLCLLLLLLL